MTDQATRVVPAGWYEDPADAEQVRWWNGIAWTDHTQPKPTSAADAETAELEKRYSESGAPPVRVRVRNVSTSTTSSWLVAFTPILFALAAVVAIIVPFYSTLGSELWALLLVPYLLSVLCAFLDVRRLKRWGLKPPAAIWALLGPLYLVVRKFTVAGWGQLVALVVLLVGLGGVGFAVSSTELGKPITLALTVQSTIRSELVGSGEALDVACPPIADSTAVGTVYTCDVTLATHAHKQLLVSIDSDKGDFSYTYSLK
ncbi:DUF2510 domain-containing protein [Protaetiibacter larvae]|uniref:DUF2510 domain-containing protein n=1 Tax=Protaetiibacter larvae TaxID=2592654 RepID=A0A5C1YBQ7_9MICO|nr:DUF2510 domain-containing protein [Protaetiibacter larvae]QEO10297.1 DUF2510 domain-containing protein [Protaetiibacter larvae]